MALCAGFAVLGALPMRAGEGAFPPLNEPPTADGVAGKFIWADLFTPDPMAATKSYEGMFGWAATTFSRAGRIYVLLTHDNRAIAGIVQRPPGRATQAPGRWVGYVAVCRPGHAGDTHHFATSLPQLDPRPARGTMSGGLTLMPCPSFHHCSRGGLES